MHAKPGLIRVWWGGFSDGPCGGCSQKITHIYKHMYIPMTKHTELYAPQYQWEFQDPKIQVR